MSDEPLIKKEEEVDSSCNMLDFSIGYIIGFLICFILFVLLPTINHQYIDLVEHDLVQVKKRLRDVEEVTNQQWIVILNSD
jgi:hypothetical protein